MSKPYPKYKYQSVSTGPKIAEKQAFFLLLTDRI
jgi:hypothetical protein